MTPNPACLFAPLPDVLVQEQGIAVWIGMQLQYNMYASAQHGYNIKEPIVYMTNHWLAFYNTVVRTCQTCSKLRLELR